MFRSDLIQSEPIQSNNWKVIMEMDPFFAIGEASSKAVKSNQMKSEINSSSSFPNLYKVNTLLNSNNDSSSNAKDKHDNDTAHADINNDKITQANQEISSLLQQNKITQNEVSILQSILHENLNLQNKTQKLKSLLSRSAKAQSDFKNDNLSLKWKLDQAHKTIDDLNGRVEQLANRPTHMDVLADFEANFDRAMLSMATSGDGTHNMEDDYGYDNDDVYTNDRHDPANEYQPGGENPSHETEFTFEDTISTNNVNTEPQQALMNDLTTSKNRINHLESLNSALLSRASKLETETESQNTLIASLQSKNNNLQLELRMAKLETANAQRKMKEKAIALSEMQMEIDLVTKASVQANARASESLEVVKHIQTDKRHVDELEAKVDALQEWALASAEAKRLTVERAKELENKLILFHEMLELEGEGDSTNAATAAASSSNAAAGGGTAAAGLSHKKDLIGITKIGGDGATSTEGRKLWTRASSKVVGAGMEARYIVPLGDCNLAQNEMVVLKWKFDIIPGELDIDFSILKGKYEDKKKRDGADNLIKQRTVIGGAGGEVSGAFAVQNTCTLVWSNKRSWVRPRAIKFSVEAYAIN